LKSLDELPPLAELKAIGEINPQLELPGEAVGASAAGGSLAAEPDGAANGGNAVIDESDNLPGEPAGDDDVVEDEQLSQTIAARAGS